MFTTLANWIYKETRDSRTVVEFGAGFFARLLMSPCEYKVGIEISAKYIKAARERGRLRNCAAIRGDIRDYYKLLDPALYDCVMIIDVLEHLPVKDAKELIASIMRNFNKLMLMVPAGKYIQKRDPTGFGEHYYQTHKSYWEVADVSVLGFQEIILIPGYHKIAPATGCIFATWRKHGQ